MHKISLQERQIWMIRIWGVVSINQKLHYMWAKLYGSQIYLVSVWLGIKGVVYSPSWRTEADILKTW